MPQWVIPKVLARSSRPGYPSHNVSAQQVDEWLREVEELGVKSVICLLSDDQLAFYESLPKGLLGAYRARGLAVEHIPITDPAHDARGNVELEQNLQRIYECFRSLDRPVVIHCSAGVDRTGRAVRYIQKRLAHEAQPS